MSRLYIKQVPQFLGQQITIAGFVETIRDQKTMLFVVVKDSTGLVQCVFDKTQHTSLAELTIGSAIEVQGMAIAAPQVKPLGCEVQVSAVIVHSLAATPLPIAEDSSMDKQLDWRHLSLRTPRNQLMLKVQNTMLVAMREFFCQKDFTEIHTPKLMGTPSESGAEVFEVKYFDTKAYLAQSPQFYKQMAIATGLEGVFEVGPVFRAEPSFTTRHATEFTGVDAEFAWITSYKDVMAFEEQWLHFVLQTIEAKHGAEIEAQFGVKVVVPTLPFPKIAFADVLVLLAEHGHVIDNEHDLDSAGEKLLGKIVQEKYGHQFVFVTDYPSAGRAFYHMRHAENPELTCGFDLLWQGLEITTGAQREHRYETLKAQAVDRGYKLEPLEPYLNSFKYGCPPHGGFGVGLARVMMLLLGLGSIRETMFLFRGPNRLTP